MRMLGGGGDLGFETFTLEMLILLSFRGQLSLNLIMPTSMGHYYRAKCAVIKMSGWFSTCASPPTRWGRAPRQPFNKLSSTFQTQSLFLCFKSKSLKASDHDFRKHDSFNYPD